jgi:hypothetical protein
MVDGWKSWQKDRYGVKIVTLSCTPNGGAVEDCTDTPNSQDISTRQLIHEFLPTTMPDTYQDIEDKI